MQEDAGVFGSRVNDCHKTSEDRFRAALSRNKLLRESSNVTNVQRAFIFSLNNFSKSHDARAGLDEGGSGEHAKAG